MQRASLLSFPTRYSTHREHLTRSGRQLPNVRFSDAKFALRGYAMVI